MIEKEPQASESVPSIREIAKKYELDQAEHLTLLLSVAPFYLGSPHAFLQPGQEVDIDRYAQEIVAKRNRQPSAS